MTQLFNAYKLIWKGNTELVGCQRKEFGLAVLSNALVICVGYLLFKPYEEYMFLMWYSFVSSLMLINLSCHRLRDAGYSAWWILLAFTGVGNLVLLYILFLKKTLKRDDGNEYKEIYIHSSDIKNDDSNNKLYKMVDYFVFDETEYAVLECVCSEDSTSIIVRIERNGTYSKEGDDSPDLLEIYKKRKMNGDCLI